MLIEDYKLKSTQDIQEALKALLCDIAEELLNVELYEHSYYEYGRNTYPYKE